MRKCKKIIALSLAFALGVMGCTGCGSSSSGSSKVGTADNPLTVEIAILDGMAPYTYSDENGDFQGYDYEFLQKCDELLDEYEFHYNSVDADAAAAAVQAGTYAVSCSAHFVTPARQKNYLLTIPESYYPVNLVSRTEDSFDSFEELDGKSVVPDPPSDGLYVVLHDLEDENPDIKVVEEEVSEYVSYYDSCKGVANGTWDVWFGGESMFTDVMAQEQMDLYCSDPIYCASCVAVVNKDYEDLRDKLNDCIVELYNDGTLSELSEKWLDMDCFKTAEDTDALFDYQGYTSDKANCMNED